MKKALSVIAVILAFTAIFLNSVLSNIYFWIFIGLSLCCSAASLFYPSKRRVRN